MTVRAIAPHLLPDPVDLQRDASDPMSSVWVSASAGSGKTTVLTARVARLLLLGVRPEKILCLTYTRAGASEMANRLTGMLSKWAVCSDRDLEEDLDKLQNHPPTKDQRGRARRLFAEVLSCPGGLRIRTIHSFCQEILSRFPLEAGLPPHFSLIDDSKKTTIETEILNALLREADNCPGDALAQSLAVLVASQGESGFTKILQEIVHTRGHIETATATAGGKSELASQVYKLLGVDSAETVSDLRREAMASITDFAMMEMAKWLLKEKPGSRFEERGRKLKHILEKTPTERESFFDEYVSLFITEKKTPKAPTHIASKDVRSLHPEVDLLSCEEALRLLKILERIEAVMLATNTNAVLSFGAIFTERLTQAKVARALLDYDDLILYTERLLNRSELAPWILYKLDNGIDHMLVDEAQDTSRAQWNIVQALVEEFYAGLGAQINDRRTLFVVGDEKQSIFSFQNADPEAFLGLRLFFSRRFEDAGKTLHKIPLHTSFRSAPAILYAVDKIFASPAARDGVSPDPIEHRSTRNRDGSEKSGKVEIWPLLRGSEEDAADSEWALPVGYEEEHDPQAELAQKIAKKIRRWLDESQNLPGMNRSIVAGDIMILLRRRGRFADLMVRALKANNVPVTGVDRMRLVAQLSVMDLLSIMKFVLLPEDDLNLATILRGPFVNVSEDQLMDLAVGREGSLWERLRSSHQFSEVTEYLEQQLAEADFSPPFAFLSRILYRACPSNKLSGKKALWARLGEESLDPIDELLNEAQEFGSTHAPSLQGFLNWLTQSNTEIKRELDQGGGQVRIMTVHASKGLEAPIVFLPDTASVPLPQALPKIQWTKSDIPLFLSSRPGFGIGLGLWQTARSHQMDEYRRLFYVALTRAANQLYISGWIDAKKEGAPAESWYGMAISALRPYHDATLHGGDETDADVIIADAFVPTVSCGVTQTSLGPLSLPKWTQDLYVSKPEDDLFLQGTQEERASATPDAAFARGRIIHRLLQSLPAVMPEKRSNAAKRFLAHPRYGLDRTKQNEILSEVEALLNNPEFATLFGPGSLAEAPLTGLINGVSSFRQIDRLCLRDKEVWIVDYKTNRPPPLTAKEIPSAYRLQLQEYQTLLRQIYPQHQVRCFLLWTYAPKLMEITF